MSLNTISENSSLSMMEYKKLGDIETNKEVYLNEEVHIKWKINCFHIVAKGDTFIPYHSPIFVVANVPWFLKLYPKCSETSKPMRLYLLSNVKRSYLVEYNFGLMIHQYDVAQDMGRGIMKEDATSSDPVYLNDMDILQLMIKHSFPDDMAITCSLKRKFEYTFPVDVLDTSKPSKFVNLDRLSENFIKLYNDKETCDLTLKMKDREYKAHRAVLIARSPVFGAMFKHETLEKQTGIVNISDCDPDSFQEFLKYLYCGKIEQISYYSVLHLYETSNKYDVQELKNFCIEYLVRLLTVENVCEILTLANRYNEMKLFSFAQDFFIKNVSKIFGTSEWESLLKEDCQLGNKLLIEMAKVRLKE